MRVAVMVASVVVSLGLAPMASAGVFPDLPGFGVLGETTSEEASSGLTDGKTSVSAPAASDARAPAPSSKTDPAKLAKDAVSEDELAVVTSLPGGSGLPIIGDVAAAASRNSLPVLATLAAFFVIVYTRFLYRLNELGRRG